MSLKRENNPKKGVIEMEKYIEILEKEIEELTEMEKKNGRVNMGVEQRLHILFENCKHAKDFHSKHSDHMRESDS